MNDRAFKGVWIPKHIWEHKDLSLTERCLLAEVDSLTGDSGCFASREFLAERMHVSKQHITDMLTKLRKLNLIVDISFDGRTRVMAPAWSSDGSFRGVPTEIPLVSQRKIPWSSEATIVLDNKLDNSKIINTPEEAEELLGDSGSLSEFNRAKLERRAKKNARLKSSFISPGFGVRPTKGRFEQKRREGVNAEDVF